MFRTALAALALTLAAGTAAAQQLPEGYPADYQAVVDAARKEGTVTVYATTDSAAAAPLIKDFEAAFPGVKVEYSDLNSTELYNRFISEAAAGGSADLLWSGAPDLQIKLAADGYAMTYASPELKSIPGWAAWKEQAYGTTFEPMVMVYNKRLVPAEDVPKSHGDLARLLEAKTAKYRGKVTAYDPERSGVGFLLITRDLQADPKGWDLFRAFGKTSVKLYTSAGAMLERTASGEHLIAYNIFGSYARLRQKKDPNLGVVLPKDYTLIASRVAFVPKAAKHPNAGKLFLDYLLSKRGQKAIADGDLYSIRDDVEGEATAKQVKQELGDAAKPIPVSDELLAMLDQQKRLEVLKTWQGAMRGK